MNVIAQKVHSDELPTLFKADGGWSPADVRELIGEAGSIIGVAEMEGALVGYIYAEIVKRGLSVCNEKMSGILGAAAARN